MKKKIVITILVLITVGVSAYYYTLYGGARNLSSEEAVFSVSSQSISNEFNSNVEKSNQKYLEKAIAITGMITQINGKQVIIDNSIICDLTALDSSIKKNQLVTLKGRVVGYDDLMAEIKLDQCSVINND